MPSPHTLIVIAQAADLCLAVATLTFLINALILIGSAGAGVAVCAFAILGGASISVLGFPVTEGWLQIITTFAVMSLSVTIPALVVGACMTFRSWRAILHPRLWFAPFSSRPFFYVPHDKVDKVDEWMRSNGVQGAFSHASFTQEMHLFLFRQSDDVYFRLAHPGIRCYRFGFVARKWRKVPI